MDAAQRKRPLAESAAVGAVQALITDARGSIFTAFDAMECGFDAQEAFEFLSGSPHYGSLPQEIQGKVLGIALGFAMVAVESDREKRGA